MASGVDFERKEHRMNIRNDDWRELRAKLIIGQQYQDIAGEGGILQQTRHEDATHTFTFYAMLKNLGLVPGERIKPRVRIKHVPYDQFSSGSPTLFSPDSKVSFAEFKYPKEEVEEDVATIFADGNQRLHPDSDAATRLIAQQDVFLLQPPTKSKSKLFGIEKDGEGAGVPIGVFLEALNSPARTEAILKKYQYGAQFAKDILAALEPFQGEEFTFGLYSRYQRWDCTFRGKDGNPDKGYRTTFDPYTVLGFIKEKNSEHQLQKLRQEHMIRWEHKIDPASMDQTAIAIISEYIKQMREEYLIPRCLSKSLTALTLLADFNEAQIGAKNEIGVQLSLTKDLPNSKVGDLSERKRLHSVFNGAHPFAFHPFCDEPIQRYTNHSVGEKRDLEYLAMNATMDIGDKPFVEHDEGYTITMKLAPTTFILTSANELRRHIDDDITSQFDRTYALHVEEYGYIVKNGNSGRVYTVSFGKKQRGQAKETGIFKEKQHSYMKVKYLGIEPQLSRGKVQPFTEEGLHRKAIILQEMKHIMNYLHEKKVI